MQFDFFQRIFTPETEAPLPGEGAPRTEPAPAEVPAPLSSPASEPAATSPANIPSAPAASSRAIVPPIAELHALASRLLRAAGAEALAAQFALRWNPRLRNTAGMAYPGRKLITLNPRLAAFGHDEIDRTLRHELAHLLAHDRAGRRRIDPHGKEWKRACADLGLAGEKRTHDLPLPRHRVQPRYFYHCPGCAFVLKRVRPLRRNSACVQCCRTHNRGRYDARFRFLPAPAPQES